MAAAAIVVGMVGIATKIASDVQTAQAQQKAADATAQGYDYDATVASTNANVTRAQTATDAIRMGVMARRNIGSMSATYGASGVTKSGSVLDVLSDSASQAQADSDNFKQQGALKAGALDAQAGFDTDKANYYRTAGGDAAAALGFKAGGDIASAFPKIAPSSNYGYAGAGDGS